MNTPNRPTKEPDDHDIAALFNAQLVTAPDELDTAILAAAKQAVTDAPTPDTQADAMPAIKPLSKATNRWFALAATVVIGISVTPLLLKSPETSLNAPVTAPVEVIAESAQLIESDNTGGAAGDLLVNEESDSIALSDESVAVEAGEQSSLKKAAREMSRDTTMGATMEAEAEELDNAEVTITTRSRIASSAAPAVSTLSLNDTKRALLESGDNKHRDTAENWIKEILRLESIGDIRQASAEYILFRKNHPDFKPVFKREFNLRSPTNDPSGAD